MKRTATLNAAPEADYNRAVDSLLAGRFGTSISRLLAQSIVSAARRAGYSPLECVELLARVDGLE